MVCVRALVRITNIQVRKFSGYEDPGANAEWRLTIYADGGGGSEFYEWSNDNVKDNTPYPINQDLYVDLINNKTTITLRAGGYEEDDFSPNDVLPTAEKTLVSTEDWNIGGTTSISASNDEGSYTVNFEIKCAAEASGLTAGDVIRYGGVWRQGNEEQQIIGIKRQLDWNDFSAEWEEFSKKKLRLVDLETYVQDGSRKYAGVFHRGNDGYALWVGLTGMTF